MQCACTCATPNLVGVSRRGNGCAPLEIARDAAWLGTIAAPGVGELLGVCRPNTAPELLLQIRVESWLEL